MKTKCMWAAAALCLALPAAASAQGLPDFLAAVTDGVEEGVERSAARIAASMEEELGLALAADCARMEAGQTLTLTITAQNPRASETPVAFTLNLPERIACEGETAWEAVLLPAAAGEDGTLVPGVTTFTRTLSLAPGGVSETAVITCEMSMGTRFYRAQQELALCVADVSVTAGLEGADNGRLQPGDAFTWTVDVTNAGMAAKDVDIALVLPSGVAPAAELPEGFARAGQRITGKVTAQSVQEDETGAAASLASIALPMQVEADALAGDSDALRLMAGTLYADGKRVPLPRIQVCGAKISACLLAEESELEIGGETVLRVMVLNEGLAGAQVNLACALPQGLAVTEETQRREEEAAQKAAVPPAEDTGAGPDAAPALAAQEKPLQTVNKETNTVTFNWYMEPAQETEDGVTAATCIFELPVRALAPQEDLKEALVGASLAYSVDGGDTRLGEAAALRLYKPSFLGIALKDWGGVFWACVLMMITVACLCGAVRAGGDKEDYYCCE